MGALFAWLQNTSAAEAIGGSTLLTGSLSAVHVVGFMLVTGAALVTNLRALGVLLPTPQRDDFAAQANRVILLGLALSVLTGALLFSARATEVSTNGIFQLKMSLLLAAVLVHFVVTRNVRTGAARGPLTRAAHALSLALWLGLAATACAFILLE